MHHFRPSCNVSSTPTHTMSKIAFQTGPIAGPINKNPMPNMFHLHVAEVGATHCKAMMFPLFTIKKNFVPGAKLGSFLASNLEVMISKPKQQTNVFECPACFIRRMNLLEFLGLKFIPLFR